MKVPRGGFSYFIAIHPTSKRIWVNTRRLQWFVRCYVTKASKQIQFCQVYEHLIARGLRTRYGYRLSLYACWSSCSWASYAPDYHFTQKVLKHMQQNSLLLYFKVFLLKYSQTHRKATKTVQGTPVLHPDSSSPVSPTPAPSHNYFPNQETNPDQYHHAVQWPRLRSFIWTVDSFKC